MRVMHFLDSDSGPGGVVLMIMLMIVTRFYRCLGYVLVVLNLSVPKIIIS